MAKTKYNPEKARAYYLAKKETIIAKERARYAANREARDGSRQTHVDHDHKTGLVRGMLCVDCNVGLGRFKDNAEALRRAADYVGRLEPVRVYSNGR